ncbi:MAG: hypothetical protein J0L89_04945 [Xanthomonadales bacterium]|nr:hypothetical protein [Xanthomonadales bacterium]
MSIIKNGYTKPLRHPTTLYFFARNELNAIAFDLLNWEGSRERAVSAWKLLTSAVLKARQQRENNDEVALLYGAVVKDVGEDTAQHEFGVYYSGSFDSELNEWYQAYITLADNYGFHAWPMLALADYLREFEGYDDARAKATAQRAWETALMVYDAGKLADKKPAEKQKKKAA